MSCNSSGSGRRATEPALGCLPRLHLQVHVTPTVPSRLTPDHEPQLHVDYLSTHSSYIRALLSGTSPLDLVWTTTQTFSGPRSDHRYSVPENRLPRLISGPSNHPTLFLPVPDPSSFHLIVHWMYFGNTTFIEECLHKKIVHWEGLARNVEYLGVSSELKVFLKTWYYREENGDSGKDCHPAYNDSGCNSEMADYDSVTASGDESDIEFENAQELSRGRRRIRHPLPIRNPEPGRGAIDGIVPS
ncbi:hypothetical protein C0992_000712 [Termitomyces sp. T32_za158]|nr:hypothetical protein C0992_000712 [Termitomyces sp. T32_za158]